MHAWDTVNRARQVGCQQMNHCCGYLVIQWDLATELQLVSSSHNSSYYLHTSHHNIAAISASCALTQRLTRKLNGHDMHLRHIRKGLTTEEDRRGIEGSL